MTCPLADNSTLLMIGDSITDCGRTYPVGDGKAGIAALGDGYVSYMAEMFASICPEKGIHLINMGINGNTVVDLTNRWQCDVLDLGADWLSVKIGINDVWREMEPTMPESERVPIDLYERLLEQLVRTTRPTVQGMILATPYLIEADIQDPMRSKMDDYALVVRRLATKYDTIFVDTQAGFNEVLAFDPATPLADDRVHPNNLGHMIIARAFMSALGFKV